MGESREPSFREDGANVDADVETGALDLPGERKDLEPNGPVFMDCEPASGIIVGTGTIFFDLGFFGEAVLHRRTRVHGQTVPSARAARGR